MTARVSVRPADWELAGRIRVRSTGCAQGDLGGGGPAVDSRRRAVVDLPWTVLNQVHGARVVVVEGPGGATGEAADAAVATSSRTALAVLTADCAPVALASPEGVLGAAHAGWKGLRAGVVEATVTTMRRLGATRVEAVLGPCIHPCCYAFGAEELGRVESRLGAPVRSFDRHGDPALDLPAGVRAALHASGAVLVGDAGTCTGCSESFWSWRGSGADRRQATVVWRP
jgi:hypothetical protein